MTKFTVVNDCHYGSRYQDDPRILDKLLLLPADANTVFIGDNVDLACCPKSDVKNLEKLELSFHLKHGKNYDHGNHERISLEYKYIIKETASGSRVLFVHGDLEGNPVKWHDYRGKSHGASLLKLAATFVFDGMDWLKDKRPLPDGFLDRAAYLAMRMRCQYYVCGHFHPLEKREYDQSGIKIIIMNRGINELIIP